MKNVLILFAMIFFITGCDSKRESIGGDNEIIVITAPETEHLMKAALSRVFIDTVYAPQPEPVYTIKYAHPEGFSNLKRQTNLVIGSIGNDLTNPGTKLVKDLLGMDKFSETLSGDQHVFFTRDQFARNQLFVLLSAASVEDLHQELAGKADWIRGTFDQKYDQRQEIFLFGSTTRKKIEKRFMSDYQWSVKIPWGWEIIKEKPDSQFVWIGKEMPYQWLSVHWEDGMTVQNDADAVETLKNYPKLYYGTIQTHNYQFKVEPCEINHWTGWKSTGIWESIEEPKGGPYISYVFYDGVTDRTYLIHMIVHYPQKEKTVFLHQLDLMAKSFMVTD